MDKEKTLKNLLKTSKALFLDEVVFILLSLHPPEGHESYHFISFPCKIHGGKPIGKPSHLANGPWNKSLKFIFPTKYGIPKSLKG